MTTLDAQPALADDDTTGASIDVLTRRSALKELGTRLDELQLRTDCPVTARRPWQQAWLDHYSDHSPLVVVVTGSDGRLRGAAPLAVRHGGPLSRVVALGDGPSDAVRLPAVDASAAQRLARGVARALDALDRPWLLSVRQADPREQTVDALAATLRRSAVTPAEASPWLAFGPDRSLRAHVSRNHHQQVRRMRNRLAREGLSPVVEQLRSPGQLAAVWPEVERVCRLRDVQLRGHSDLDDPHAGPFFRDVVQRLAARDEVRLTTLRLEGRLAAYVLSFQDGPVRRMWSCRLDPVLQEFGVGRVANDAALEDALRDPACTSFDWMRGEEPYKASMSDQLSEAVDLTACSYGALWALVRASGAARLRLRDVRDRGGPVGRAVRAAQPTLQRLDRLR